MKLTSCPFLVIAIEILIFKTAFAEGRQTQSDCGHQAVHAASAADDDCFEMHGWDYLLSTDCYAASFIHFLNSTINFISYLFNLQWSGPFDCGMVAVHWKVGWRYTLMGDGGQ